MEEHNLNGIGIEQSRTYPLRNSTPICPIPIFIFITG